MTLHSSSSRRPTSPSAGHIAIITSPLPGHLNPVQVLARMLIARGWRVSVVHLEAARRFVTEPEIGFSVTPPCDGLEFDSYLARLANPTGPGRLLDMIRATAALTDHLLATAPKVLTDIGATAVLADAVEPAGPLIARRLSLPYAVAVTGLPLHREANVPPPFVDWGYRPSPLGRFRNQGGYWVTDCLMQPIDRVLEKRRREWKLDEHGDPPLIQVAQCPSGLDFPRQSLPSNFRYGSPWRSDADEEVDLPQGGPPLVFCSLGTLQGARRDLFAIMSSACAAIGARAVIAHGGGLSAAEAEGLPGNPLVRAFWPQAEVLRRCSAAILHGGFNSVLDALAAGVPIVALPIAFEQPATAARLAWIGAGRTLSPHRLTERKLATALAEVIDQPSYREAARRIALEISADRGAAGAADLINAALTPA